METCKSGCGAYIRYAGENAHDGSAVGKTEAHTRFKRIALVSTQMYETYSTSLEKTFRVREMYTVRSE